MNIEIAAFFAKSIPVGRNGSHYIPTINNMVETMADKEIIIYKNGDILRVKDLKSLAPRKWITSQILNIALRDLTRIGVPYPVVMTLEDGESVLRRQQFGKAAINKLQDTDDTRIILLPLWNQGHYTLVSIDRIADEIQFLDSSKSNSPEDFPDEVFQKVRNAMWNLHMQDRNYTFVHPKIRQQGNSYDCALHVLTHGMNINMSAYERTNDMRFSAQAMYELRKSLLASFLEDKVWADQEERQIRIFNPEYRAPQLDIIEISDDDIEDTEHENGTNPEKKQEHEPVLDEGWKLVKSIKELEKKFGSIHKMETILRRNPTIIKEWIQRSYEPTSSPNKFKFGPLRNKMKFERMLKQAEAKRKRNQNKKKRRALKKAQKIVNREQRSPIYSPF